MSSFFYDQNTGCAEACEDSLDFSHDPRVAPGPESWRLMGYPTACNESCAEACVDEFRFVASLCRPDPLSDSQLVALRPFSSVRNPLRSNASATKC